MDSRALLIVALVALMPVTEVRGAIPLVVALSKTPLELGVGLAVSVASNMTVPLLVFKLLDVAERVVYSRWMPGFVKTLYNRLISIGRKKAAKMKGASYAALALFVGVPLPVTGAWTGTLVAFVLGLDRKRATLAIMAGVLMASLLVSLASLAGLEILKRLFIL